MPAPDAALIPVTLSEQIGLTRIAPVIDLRGRNVVITGAGDGIGRDVAKAYRRFGAHVIGLDIQEDKLKSLAAELGSGFDPVPCDLGDVDEEKFAKLSERILNRAPNGAIDVFVINAGLIKASNERSIALTPLFEAVKLMNVNLLSHFLLCKNLLPALSASGAGRIVLTSSPIVGRKDPSSAFYAITKKALDDMLAMVRMEVRGQEKCGNLLVAGYVPPPVQNWLRAHWKNEPFAANPLPVDVVELPLRLGAPALLPEFDGKVLSYEYETRRTKGIKPAGGGDAYDAINRTENGFDLGIHMRTLGEGGGDSGTPLIAAYDTWHARRLMGAGPVPPLDENLRLRDIANPPAYIARALGLNPDT